MKLLKVGAAALNQTPLAWEENARNITAAIEEARAAGVSILCLPELCITGYGCEDAFFSPGVHRMAVRVLAEIAPQTRGMVVSVGLPVFVGRSLFNAACLLVDGHVAGFACKRFLAGSGVHYEPRWFRPWPEGERSEIEIAGGRYPIGDLVFDCGGIRIGFEICEDAWAPDRPGVDLARKGVDVILNPSASHFAFGKEEVRQRFVLDGSRAFAVAYVYANLLGNEAGRIIYDGGALIANQGSLITAGRRFAFREVDLTCAVVDIEANRIAQSHPSPPVTPGAIGAVQVDFDYPELLPVENVYAPLPWETSAALKEEEFTRAITLGLFDYMRKSRSRGFVVSLSGGADSSAVSSLVALMVERAMAELGISGVRERLAYLPEMAEVASTADMVRALLACVYQSTRNSSEITRTAARNLAEELGAEFFEFDVDDLVSAYTELVSGAIGRGLDWETDDIALQNIQARARGPGVWMLANLRRALLLATSNRSEAAVGYATMDGDTCGGLSPIAGIDKAFLRRWLVWLEREGPSGMHNIPALAAVNAQQPTAELRPPDAHQTDEEDLMPYEVLDAIEASAIRDKHTPLEVFLEMRARFPQYSVVETQRHVERFFNLWSRNQWKRERYAPSFHVDDKNLDPKTWCRFPILSGGFARELAELREYVDSL